MTGQLKTRWRPIETAPRDGTSFQAQISGNGDNNIIAWFGGLIDTEGNECEGWHFMGDGVPPESWTDGVCWEKNDEGKPSVQPTRWAPLPSPPKDE